MKKSVCKVVTIESVCRLIIFNLQAAKSDSIPIISIAIKGRHRIE